MKEVGAKLDLDFEVNVVEAGTKKRVLFSDLIERDTLVSVYMRNNTSSCDRQTAALKEAYEALTARGVKVVAVSKDTPGSHAKYCEKGDLPFVLVSDPEHLFAHATDSLVEKKMYGKVFHGPTRSAYLIGSDFRLKGVIEKVDAKAHTEQVLALVEGR